jgi:hypothetical protein
VTQSIAGIRTTSLPDPVPGEAKFGDEWPALEANGFCARFTVRAWAEMKETEEIPLGEKTSPPGSHTRSVSRQNRRRHRGVPDKFAGNLSSLRRNSQTSPGGAAHRSPARQRWERSATISLQPPSGAALAPLTTGAGGRRGELSGFLVRLYAGSCEKMARGAGDFAVLRWLIMNG